MSEPLHDLLDRGTVLLDGGMGSSLIARGLPAGTPPESWTLRRPDAVLEAHGSFLAAGSDVVQTNTFGANGLSLERHGLAANALELNREAARIARLAVDEAIARGHQRSRGPLVAGNIGPSGRFLPPVGDADLESLGAAFTVQAEALAEGGVDYIAIETMTDLSEALCALRAAREATSLPVTVCLTYDRKPRGFFTLMGQRVEDAVTALADAGAAAVGANCSIGSAHMLEACALLLDASPVPVIVEPNAGLPEVVEGVPRYLQPTEEFAADVARMAKKGAAMVGGCCGADAAFIAALRRELRGEEDGARPELPGPPQPPPGGSAS